MPRKAMWVHFAAAHNRVSLIVAAVRDSRIPALIRNGSQVMIFINVDGKISYEVPMIGEKAQFHRCGGRPCQGCYRQSVSYYVKYRH